MKTQRKIVIIFTLFTLFIFLISSYTVTFASDITETNKENEYTEEYKKWNELSDEEKQDVIMPRKFEIPYTDIQYENPIVKAKMLGTSLTTRFSLKDIIESNTSIKNQQDTSSCWAFAALSSLETNLALQDYYNGLQANLYDFSERHMEYATSREFLNNQINANGYNRLAGSGGIWNFAESYLTNGTGAISESDMPFENNNNKIEISKIQNKEVISQVDDTIEFPDYLAIGIEQDKSDEIKAQIKNHIKNNGSIFCSIVAGGSFSRNISYIDSTTGAVGVSSGSYGDHAVSIIGWDDDYSVSNWNSLDESKRPKAKGAWIARNTWGTDYGDNGLIYISYEDKTTSMSMYGIAKASNKKEYNNIYEHTNYSYNSRIAGKKKTILLNAFDKKTDGKEYLKAVSLNVLEPCSCKVYVNATGTDKSKDSLKHIQLQAGEEEKFDNAGYHTLEFATPVEITSSKFCIAIEISFNDNTLNRIPVIQKDSNYYSEVEAKSGECFILHNYGYVNIDGQYGYDYENYNDWIDLGQQGLISTLKAFTTTQEENTSEKTNNIKMITVKTAPAKTTYTEGENFDKSGMVIEAIYEDGTTKEVLDYQLENENSLTKSQTEITIIYDGKTTKQPITVLPKEKEEKPTPEEPTKDEKNNTQEQPTEDVEIIEEVQPKNSEFENAKGVVENLKYYLYTDLSKKEYMIIDITVNGISKASGNDSYEYYYYLSNNKNEEEIADWVKIDSYESKGDKLSFKINTKDINNYSDISTINENNLFLYLTEVAVKGKNESTLETYAIPVNASEKINIETYLDDKIVEDSFTEEDNTVSDKQLPFTGFQKILILMTSILTIGILTFIRYKKLSKYIK